MEIGRYNNLKIIRRNARGLILGDEDGEVSLPKREIPADLGDADELKVFVYNSGKDSLAATTMTPTACLGEFGYFRVKETGDMGAFLDWGIPKDLFVPRGAQKRSLRQGEWVIAFVALDSRKTGLIGFTDLDPFLKRKIQNIRPGQKVKFLVRDMGDNGARLIVEDLYQGLIYKQDLEPGIRPGDIREGWVRKIRGDGKLDIGVWQKNIQAADHFKENLLAKIAEAGGFLNLNDDSPPEVVRERLGMSKRAFKMTAGILLKEGKIQLHEKGLVLTGSRAPKTIKVKAKAEDLGSLVKPGYDPASPPPSSGRPGIPRRGKDREGAPRREKPRQS